MKKSTPFFIFILFLFPVLTLTVKAAQKPSVPIETGLFNFKELVLIVGDQKQVVPENQLRDLVSIEPTLKMGAKNKSEIENINYCPTSPVLCKLFFSVNRSFFIKKETGFSINKENLQNFVNNIADDMNQEAVNAKFKIESDGTVSFTPDQKGTAIDETKSIALISEALTFEEPFQDSKEINLPYSVSEPEIKASEVNDMGINTIIGEGKSNFRGSTKNRIFNINIATEKFNGVLIKPGEEFSFISTLGPVDGEHGYAPELVIKKDKTEPEFGGGICQVSTTAFRAAINSGLEITARRNHAYPVAYYNPQGMDATVYIPKPDLKFVNNTPSNILIQTKIEGTQLTFQFFGTSDGRKVEVVGPKILERKPDGSMKTTFSQKVTDKDGNVIIDDVFNSNYDSPSKYPHPGEEKLTTKPKNWSNKEWSKYKQTNGI